MSQSFPDPIIKHSLVAVGIVAAVRLRSKFLLFYKMILLWKWFVHDAAKEAIYIYLYIYTSSFHIVPFCLLNFLQSAKSLVDILERKQHVIDNPNSLRTRFSRIL